MKPKLNAPGTKRLKPKYDRLLSNVAFKFNLRHYIKCWGDNDVGQLGQGSALPLGGAAGQMGDALPPVQLFAAESSDTILRLFSSTDYSCAIVTTNAAGTTTVGWCRWTPG
jgi:hypothetical protein